MGLPWSFRVRTVWPPVNHPGWSHPLAASPSVLPGIPRCPALHTYKTFYWIPATVVTGSCSARLLCSRCVKLLSHICASIIVLSSALVGQPWLLTTETTLNGSVENTVQLFILLPSASLVHVFRQDSKAGSLCLAESGPLLWSPWCISYIRCL